MTKSSGIMIQCEGLTKEYQEIKALTDLNLSIPAGHVFGYIGHNGAGKTTTIRILAGLLRPSRGKARIAGVDVTGPRDKVRSLVGYMPDDFGVYDQMRVWEYLDFFGAAHKVPRKLRRQRLDYALDVTGSEEFRDRFVDTLSRGMKQRVGVARTLMHDPHVLLLDEPANGLDPSARIHMRGLLRKLADSGKTLLVSSHILPELAAVCDSIGILHGGTLRAFGKIDDVLSRIQRDRLMELKLLGEAGPVIKALQADPKSSDVDGGDAAGGIVRFRFSGDDESLSRRLEKLLAAGVRVVTLREVPLSLEDAYMAISAEVPGAEEPAEKVAQQ